ncbi:MAG: hypothetical protein P1U42_00560 [Phycisphaerales bacterium]|nr:hypothetical protein [Phycisphaerales bacterium]
MFTKSIIVLVSIATPSMAFAQHADLLLIKDDMGNLLTGQYDFGTNEIVNTNTRVYEGEFDSFGTSDEPGFNALSASSVPTGFQGLDANSSVQFDANSINIGNTSGNLYYWDGNGAVDFNVSSNSLTISKAPSALFSILLDGSDSDVDGFEIDTTSSDGFLHKHIDLALTDISSSADGFYLWSLSLESGNSSSDPIFFVHGFGVENEIAHEAAIDWVQSTLVPAPGVLSLLVGLPVVAGRRRR